MSLVNHIIDHAKLGFYPNGPNIIPVGVGGKFATLDGVFTYLATLTGDGNAYTMISGDSPGLSGTTAPGTLSVTINNAVFTSSEATAWDNARPGDFISVWGNAANTQLHFHHIDSITSTTTVRCASGGRATNGTQAFAIWRPIHYTILLTDDEYGLTPAVNYELPFGMSVSLCSMGQMPRIYGISAGSGSPSSQTWRYTKGNSLLIQDVAFYDVTEFIAQSATGGAPGVALANQHYGNVIKINNVDYICRADASGLDCYGGRVWVNNLKSVNAMLRGCQADDLRLTNSTFDFTDSSASATGAIDFGMCAVGQAAYPGIIKNVYAKSVADRTLVTVQAVVQTGSTKTCIIEDSHFENAYSANEAVDVVIASNVYMKNCIVESALDFSSTAGTLYLDNVRRKDGTNVTMVGEGSLATVKVKGKDRVKALTQPIANAEFNYLHGDIFTITLTAARTFANTINGQDGDEITFIITEDGTAGHAVTWNAAYHFTAAWTDSTVTTDANKVSTVTFRKSGSVWYQTGPANTWIA